MEFLSSFRWTGVEVVGVKEVVVVEEVFLVVVVVEGVVVGVVSFDVAK